MSKHEQHGKKIAWIPAVIAVVLLPIAFFFIGRWVETKNEPPEARGDYRERMLYSTHYEIDGKSYWQRKSQNVILLIGVDENAKVPDDLGNGAPAAFLRLVVVDHIAGRVSQIDIDPETVTPVKRRLPDGTEQKIELPVGLAHCVGDEAAENCRNTVDAVSELLMNVRIDRYASLSTEGFSLLRELVGGEAAECTDMPSTADTVLKMLGKMSVNDVNELFDALKPHICVSVTRQELMSEAVKAKDYERGEPVVLPTVTETAEDGSKRCVPDRDGMTALLFDTVFELI